MPNTGQHSAFLWRIMRDVQHVRPYSRPFFRCIDRRRRDFSPQDRARTSSTMVCADIKGQSIIARSYAQYAQVKYLLGAKEQTKTV
jgi:hypothetical protein